MSQLKSLFAGTAMALGLSIGAQTTPPRTDSLANSVQGAAAKTLTGDDVQARLLGYSNFQTDINGVEISGGLEYSKLRGAILKGGIAKMVGKDGALAIDFKVGKEEREILAQFGMNVTEGTMIKVSFAHLEQVMDFIFPSGMERSMMSQNTFGATLRIRGGDVVKFFELSGYHIDAQGHDFGAKEYTIDTATLYQLFSDPRRIAGSRTNGVEGKMNVIISEKNRISVEFTAGVVSRTYQTVVPTPAETSGVVGAKLMFPITQKIDGYIGIRQEKLGNERIILGATGSGVKLEIYTDKDQNGIKNNGGMVTMNIPLNADFTSALPRGNTSIAQGAPKVGDNYQEKHAISFNDWIAKNPAWTSVQDISQKNSPPYQVSDVLRMIKDRPGFIPNSIYAKVDQTALPRLVVQIDKTVLPAGSTIDKVTGDVMIALPGAPGSILSAVNTTTGNSVLGSFEVVGNNLKFKAKTLEGQLATGTNTILVETANQFITLTIEKGSVKLTNVQITIKILPVTPGAPSVSANDTTNAIVYGSLTPSEIANLEYSTNNGSSYSATVPTIGTGTLTVLVRVKALGINPASSPTTLNFTTDPVTPDATPDAYTVPAQTNLQRSTTVDSTPVTISGINQPTPVSVTGGLISINGGAFAASGTISNGQSLVVRLTTSANYATATTATANVGGVTADFTATTLANGAPTLSAVTDVTLTSGTAGSIVLPAGSDTAGDTLTYTATNLPTGFTFTPATRTLSWTAGTTAGTYTITYTVTDQGNLASSQPVKAIVSAPLDTTPPVLSSSPSLSAANIGSTSSHTLTFDENISSFTFGTLPTGMTASVVSISGSNVNISISTSASFTSFGSVNIPYTAKDSSPAQNALSGNLSKSINDVAPVSGGAFAILSDMAISDFGGGGPITPINAGGVTDPLNRTIIYSVIGLPTGLTINSNTGVISGLYDANGQEIFTITVIATPQGGTIPLTKQFVLTINDMG